jgi:hypothetical protein
MLIGVSDEWPRQKAPFVLDRPYERVVLAPAGKTTVLVSNAVRAPLGRCAAPGLR